MITSNIYCGRTSS